MPAKKQAEKSRESAPNKDAREKNQERKPKPPFPKQHQQKPGKESELSPRPKYHAPEYRAAGKLEGKAALITGGDSGIGRAVAVLYAREGADVAINYLPEEQDDAEETREAVEAEGRKCVLLPGDLTEEGFCAGLITSAVKQLGKLDILVSNAAHQNRKELDEVTYEEFDRTFKTNVYAYFQLVQAAVKHMPRGSAIIATGSETGLEGSEKLTDYSATKGAIHALTKTFAKMLVEKGIRVNCVAPGPVWTPLNPADTGATPEKVSKFGEDTAMERPAQPEEIAPAYVFFASNADSSYISGVVLPEMGGETTNG